MKRGSFGVFILLLLFINLPAISAIGISPTHLETTFEPGASISFIFTIINSGKTSLNTTLGVGGDIDYIVKYDRDSSYELDPGATKNINITLLFPDKLEPGLHRLSVMAKEIPFGGAVLGISVSGEVGGTLDVFVPYPGTYATLSLRGNNANVGDSVTLTMTASNRGRRPIDNLVAHLDVIDSNNVTFDSFIRNIQHLLPGENRDVSISLDTKKYVAGSYVAMVRGKYNAIIIPERTFEFRIGRLSLDIVNFTITSYGPNIRKFLFNLVSAWNSPLEEIHAEISIYNNKHEPVDSFKTPSVSLAPWGKVTISSFWDAKDLPPGDYTAEVHVLYQDNDEMLTIPFTIEEPSYDFNATFLIVILVVIFLFIDYFWLSKRGKKKKKDDYTKDYEL